MRIRLLHPEFFSDETLCRLTDFSRLVFAGLWLIADREGRLADNVKMIDGLILPLDRRSSKRALDELTKAGRIRRYSTPDGPVIHIVNFLKHQHIHPREKPSKFLGSDIGSASGPASGSDRDVNLPGPSATTSTSTSTSESTERAPTARGSVTRPNASSTSKQRRRAASDERLEGVASAPVNHDLLKKHGLD